MQVLLFGVTYIRDLTVYIVTVQAVENLPHGRKNSFILIPRLLMTPVDLVLRNITEGSDSRMFDGCIKMHLCLIYKSDLKNPSVTFENNGLRDGLVA